MNDIMKKTLFLIFCLFLLTGCDVQYNLTIKNNSYDERAVVSLTSEDPEYAGISNYKESKIPIYNEVGTDEYYASSLKEYADHSDVTYHYKQNSDGIKKSYFINSCFSDFDIDNDDDNINLSGSGFNCIELDDGFKVNSVEINITTKLDVLENNADSVNGNTYTWKFDEFNYGDKTVKMNIKKGLQVSDVTKGANWPITIIVLFIVLVGTIIYIFVRKKTQKSNSF